MLGGFIMKEVALWKNETRFWDEDGQTYSKNEKSLIGWFPSYQDAKRYIRNALVPWSNRTLHTSEEWDCYGWFPGYVVPRGYERLWKVTSFLFPIGNTKEVEYSILRPLD